MKYLTLPVLLLALIASVDADVSKTNKLSTSEEITQRDPYGNDVLQFHNAILKGDYKKFELYLSDGMSIDQRRGMINSTPLLAAARTGEWVAVKYLLEKGADPSLIDEYEETVIGMAEKENQTDIVELIKSLTTK